MILSSSHQSSFRNSQLNLTRIESNNALVAKVSNLPFTVNQYTFTKLIGKGGFAEVYLVNKDKYPNTHFVAKVMTVDQSEMEHKWEVFDAEVKALLALDHPHIIRLYDHFKVSNQFYLILEYCPNGSLHDEIVQASGLSIDRFIKVSSELVHAFAYCHARNIAHRDIKPENILLDENHRTKIADFGLSLKTQNGQLLRQFGGSFMYTAPEIFQKKPHDPKAADVWALGVSFSMMVTNAPPWQCESLGVMKQMAASGIIRFKKKIPDELESIIRSMIVVDPAGRVTMEELNENPFFNQPIISRPIPNMINKEPIKWGKIPRYVTVPESEMNENMFDIPFSENSVQQADTDIRSISNVLIHSGQFLKVSNRQKQRRISAPSETFKGFGDEVHEIHM